MLALCNRIYYVGLEIIHVRVLIVKTLLAFALKRPRRGSLVMILETAVTLPSVCGGGVVARFREVNK